MDFLTVLLVALFFLLMGAAIVGIIWYLQGVSRRMRAGPKAASPDAPNISEIARLMRDLQTQELVVQMDGKNFSTFQALNPIQQRRLTFTSNVLEKWLGPITPEPLPVVEAATISTENAPVSLPFEPMPGDLLQAESKPDESQPDEPATFEHASVEQHPVYTPAFTVYPEDEVAPVSTELSSMVGGMLNPTPKPTPAFTVFPEDEVAPVSTELSSMVGGMLNPTPKPTPAFTSIALQINEILQSKLAGTDLATRGITLQEGPDRGVMVTLDGRQYNGVMDVPDEDVRDAIRDAVVEWETTK